MLIFLSGEYVFEVKNIYPDERDSKITSLRVEILPHWSETFFFPLLYDGAGRDNNLYGYAAY